MGFRHSSKTYRLLTSEKNLIKLSEYMCRMVTVPYLLLVGGLNGTMDIKHRCLCMVVLFPSPVKFNGLKQEASKGVFFPRWSDVFASVSIW